MNREERDMATTQATFAGVAELTARLRQLGVREGADRGSPHTAYAPLIERPDLEVGMWTCTPGGWPIVDRDDTEIVYVISGRATITDEEGNRREVGPGDLFVLPGGWTGRWDVLESLEKLYVSIPRRQET